MKNIYFLTLVLFLCTKTLFAQESYMGEIKIVTQNYAPKGWALCNGQILSINSNQALFSLLGNNYGGNGTTTFALPDLRGRAAVGNGSTIILGEKQGAETTTLTQSNLPAHSHTVALKVNSSAATLNVPKASSAIAAPTITVNATTRATLGYNTAASNTALSSSATTAAGATTATPINTMQPYIAMTYIICIQGIYPPRN
jgi:microcystin-dependent protein